MRKLNSILFTLLAIAFLVLFQNCTSADDGSGSSADSTPSGCTTPLCLASKYSLLVADLDGSNVRLIKTSGFQDMTHPRVSNDKVWVTYTSYNDKNNNGCANPYEGNYKNTEIRAVKFSGSDDKRIIAPIAGELNSNNYWIGTTNEFSYLSGPVTAGGLKFFRTTVDAAMNVIGVPIQIPTISTVVPVDPNVHAGTGKVVYPGLYESSTPGVFVKSLFIANLNGSSPAVLTLGRDHSGTAIACANAACENIYENDPKFSPNGNNVAFMRRAAASGANGFGWHIFVVPVASPLSEVDISYSAIGSDTSKNEGLPEWIDDTTLIYSTIEVVGGAVVKNIYTMTSSGTNRVKVDLPSGFLFADVFPFTDATGKRRIVVSAEKIGATCAP